MLSVCIITKNEERHLDTCLSKLSWADEIILLDSGSADSTVEIARRHGANVFVRPFDTFSKQKNHCISLAKGDWILLIDADEYIDEALAQEIQQTVTSLHPFDGYWIKRNVQWLGSPLRFGGLRNEKVLRLIQKGKGNYRRDVHEEMVIHGSVGELKNAMLHDTTQLMEDYIRKHRHYLILDVRMRIKKGKAPSLLKTTLWAPLLFLRRYLLQGGFLDGVTGLRYQLAAAHFVWAKYTVTRRVLQRRSKPNFRTQ